MKILDSVYLVGSGEFSLTDIPSARPLYDCHVYLIDGGGELALVDAGYGGSVDQILEYMELWGLDGGRLRYCLLTHAHHDHSRAAAEWQRRLGLEVIASAPVAEALRSVDLRTLAYSCPEGTFEPCEVDRVIEDSTRIAVGDISVTAISAPGHSDGDMAYVLESNGLRTAFVGDLFTYDGVENVGFAYPFDPRRDPLKQVESMVRIYAMRPDVVLPGHGMIALRRGWRWLGTALHSVEKTGISIEQEQANADV